METLSGCGWRYRRWRKITVSSRRNPRSGGSQNLKQRKKIPIVEFPVGSGIFGDVGIFLITTFLNSFPPPPPDSKAAPVILVPGKSHQFTKMKTKAFIGIASGNTSLAPWHRRCLLKLRASGMKGALYTCILVCFFGPQNPPHPHPPKKPWRERGKEWEME